MNVQQIEEKFAAIQGNSTYLRVSEAHPLELYLGLNDQGQKTLRFNGVFTPVKIVGNALLIIKQVRTASPREQQRENEKYALRTWLLRLGFIGEEFKTARTILLKNLDGNGSWRHGRPANNEDKEEVGA